METQPLIVKEERIDDVPLLLGMMRRMGIAETFDKHLGRHHLHRGLSPGCLAVGWIAHILSQADHRKSTVQEWADGLGHTLSSFFGADLLPHEFCDDRLGLLLKNLNYADWDAIEGDLFKSCFEVYELPAKAFRVDATTAYGHHEVTPGGVMQMGHSKDHRPDLPQLKVMAAVTQPLAFPVSTSVAPGDKADDVLYAHVIAGVKDKVGADGLLFAGDCKMASLELRSRIQGAKDYYLTPLPNTGETAKQLPGWVEAALALGVRGGLRAVTRPGEDEAVARGYEFTRELRAPAGAGGEAATWTERVQVVQSLAHAEAQGAKLEKDLAKAAKALARLAEPGKGRKVWREEGPLRAAVGAALAEHGVEGLLIVELTSRAVKTRKKDGKPGRPKGGAAAGAGTETEVRYLVGAVRRNEGKIKARAERLGWRAYVTNAPADRMTLEESVLAYREGGAMERPFHDLKGEPLGISPLFVRTYDQIVGLTRLLLVALRVLTLVELVVRAGLAGRKEELPGLHEGQKNKTEGRPTGRRLLRGIARLRITLSLIQVGDRQWWFVPPPPPLLARVLELLKLPASLYTGVAGQAQPLPGTHNPSVPDLTG